MSHNTNMPFFKFDSNDWLTGKIQLCDHQTKGIFIDLAALIWRENGVLKNDRFLVRKLNTCSTDVERTLKDLKELEILEEKDGFLSIKFITNQINERSEYLKKMSENGKKSAEKRGIIPTKQKAESRKQKAEIKEKSTKENCTLADFFEVYEMKFGKLHDRQKDAIELDLMHIPEELRQEAIDGAIKFGQKTIHDPRKFKPSAAAAETRTEPKKEAFREFGGIYAD